MVQQQSFKLHVHILIRLFFFFSRQVVQEMINTNLKGKKKVKGKRWRLVTVLQGKRRLSPTWEELWSEHIQNISSFNHLQALMDIFLTQKRKLMTIRNGQFDWWLYVCTHLMPRWSKRCFIQRKIIELNVSCFLKQPSFFFFFLEYRTYRKNPTHIHREVHLYRTQVD